MRWSMNFRKIAWQKLNCSHQDLIDLLKEAYEQGRKDLLEEQKKNEVLTIKINGEELIKQLKDFK